MSTAVLWARVSSEEQEKGYSLDAQEDLLKKAAAGMEVLETFRVTESAKNSERRKKFKAMVEFVKDQKVETLVAYSTDRFARNYKDFTTLQSLIDDNNVTIILAKDGKAISRTSPVSDRFMFQILGSLDEMENRRRSDNTKRGLDGKFLKGEAPFMASPGYLNVPDPADSTGKKRTIILDPERADLMKQAFELYATGNWTASALWQEMVRRGLTSRPSPRRTSGPINRRSLLQALHNRFYIGEIFNRRTGEWVRHHYPIFVSEDTFKRVQQLLHGHNHQKTKGRHDHDDFFFKPFLKCGYCHRQITAFKTNSGHSTYYSCAANHNKPSKEKPCPRSSIYPEAKIDRLIADAVGHLYIDETVVESVKDHLRNSSSGEAAQAKREMRRLQDRMTKSRNRLARVRTLLIDETISTDEYREEKTKIEEEVADIENRIRLLNRQNFDYMEEGVTILELLHGFRDAYLRQDPTGKARILRVVLKRVDLRGKEGEDSDFHFQPPFDSLFDMGRLLTPEENVGVHP